MKVKSIIIVILSALFIIIFFQNTQVASLKLLFWKIEMSLSILSLLSLLLGIIIGYIIAKIIEHRVSKK
jgi:uncharacterized integral membrane protein